MDEEIKMKVDLEGFAKGMTAQHLALIQLLMEKGILTQDDMFRYEQLIHRMFDAQEQALAEKREEEIQKIRETDPDRYEAMMYLRRALRGKLSERAGGVGNTENGDEDESGMAGPVEDGEGPDGTGPTEA